MKIDLSDYRSKKHPILEYIFDKYYKRSIDQAVIPFYLEDISEGYSHFEMKEPVSISNTILDLTRQNRGIGSRVPPSISSKGYDLRKRTGTNLVNGKRYAGEFVCVGVGNEIQSWLIWPEKIDTIEISSQTIPGAVIGFIRNDEGGLFSVIDYCDVFTKVIWNGEYKVHRVQNPMKWQPNEIDGFYTSEIKGATYFYPVEAKALTTSDSINLDQLAGGYRTVKEKVENIGSSNAIVTSIAVRMIENGIDIAKFKSNTLPEDAEEFIRVKFYPRIPNWV